MSAHLAVLLLVAVFAAGVWRVADLNLRPWQPCRWCKGSGKHPLSTAAKWGGCAWCKGDGKKMRFGARQARRMLGRDKEE